MKLADQKNEAALTRNATFRPATAVTTPPSDAPSASIADQVAAASALAGSSSSSDVMFGIVAVRAGSKNADAADDGLGGPGYTVPAEFNKNKHVRGSLAMARSQDPDSAGSQFYFTYGAQPHLDNNYTVFGKVTSGMEHVDSIRQGDRMTSITITEE